MMSCAKVVVLFICTVQAFAKEDTLFDRAHKGSSSDTGLDDTVDTKAAQQPAPSKKSDTPKQAHVPKSKAALKVQLMQEPPKQAHDPPKQAQVEMATTPSKNTHEEAQVANAKTTSKNAHEEKELTQLHEEDEKIAQEEQQFLGHTGHVQDMLFERALKASPSNHVLNGAFKGIQSQLDDTVEMKAYPTDPSGKHGKAAHEDQKELKGMHAENEKIAQEEKQFLKPKHL